MKQLNSQSVSYDVTLKTEHLFGCNHSKCCVSHTDTSTMYLTETHTPSDLCMPPTLIGLSPYGHGSRPWIRTVKFLVHVTVGMLFGEY